METIMSARAVSQVLFSSLLFAMIGLSSPVHAMTQEELVTKIEAADYSQVRDVKSTAEGISATAMKNGKDVSLVVDSTGQVKRERSGSLTAIAQTPTKELFVMRIFLFTTLLLASSPLYPAVAQDQAKPSVQSQTDNQTVGRDWKAKPSDDQETVGKAAGKSPDSANHDDTQKVDRDWRVKPDSEDQKNRK